MKGAEFAEGEFLCAPRSNKRGTSLPKKVLTGGAIILGFIFVVFGIGLLASHFGLFTPTPFFTTR